MRTRKPHPVDIHVGKRLREQRCYAGLSQTALAGRVGITFQQLQKYEQAVNRVSASRLWELGEALGAPVEFFFPPATAAPAGRTWPDDPAFVQWVRLYHTAPPDARERLLRLVKVLAKERL